MIKQLPPILDRIADELPGFLVAAVVTREDGLSVAELSRRPDIETATASAYLASIVKSNAKAIKLLARNQTTDDIIISTDDYHFLIRDLPGLPFFLFVMTEKSEWLGRIKTIMREYEGELMTVLSEHRLTD